MVRTLVFSVSVKTYFEPDCVNVIWFPFLSVILKGPAYGCATGTEGLTTIGTTWGGVMLRPLASWIVAVTVVAVAVTVIVDESSMLSNVAVSCPPGAGCPTADNWQ